MAEALFLRRARPEEANRLTAIAHAAKRHWGYPESWIRQWRTELTFTPDYIQEHLVQVAIAGDQPVACSAVVFDDNAAVLDHLWVEPAHIGTGLGRRLLGHTLRQAREHGCACLLVDSDPHAEGFYRRQGGRYIGDLEADIDGQKRRLPQFVFDL